MVNTLSDAVLSWTWLAHPAGLYHGPWNRPTAAPILLIGNTTDPATPYASSVLMAWPPSWPMPGC